MNKPLSVIFILCLVFSPMAAKSFGFGSFSPGGGIEYTNPVEEISPTDSEPNQNSLLKIYDETENLVMLSWEPVPEAEYYEVDVLDDNGWQQIYTGSDSRFVLNMEDIYLQFRVRYCTFESCVDYLEMSPEEATRIVSGTCTTEPFCEVIGFERPIYPMPNID